MGRGKRDARRDCPKGGSGFVLHGVVVAHRRQRHRTELILRSSKNSRAIIINPPTNCTSTHAKPNTQNTPKKPDDAGKALTKINPNETKSRCRTTSPPSHSLAHSPTNTTHETIMARIPQPPSRGLRSKLTIHLCIARI